MNRTEISTGHNNCCSKCLGCILISGGILNASWHNFRCLSSGTEDNTWAQPPEPLTQAVGDSFPVVVTHFNSPSEIVVQKVENARK